MKEKNVKLRYSLRLTHLLQKERGASASHYAYSIAHPKQELTGIGATLASEKMYYNETCVNQAGTDMKINDCENAHSYGDFFSEAVLRARLNTNVAFSMLENVGSWLASLERVRNKIDDNIANFCHKTENNMISSHRVVVMYNILISSIIDECIIRLVQKELQAINRNYGTIRGIGDNQASNLGLKHLPKGFPRLHSQQFNLNQLRPQNAATNPFETTSLAKSLPVDYAGDVSLNAMKCNSNQKMTMDDGYFSTIYKSNEPPSFLGCKAISLDKFDTRIGRTMGYGLNDSSSPNTAPQNILPSPTVISPTNQSNSLTDGVEYMVPIQKVPSPSKQQKMKGSLVSLTESPSTLLFKSTEKSSSEARNLLNLLLSFVRLKESTGLERAILCSLMALSTDDDDTIHRVHLKEIRQQDQKDKSTSSKTIRHSTSKLFNDLVVEEANQRKIVRELRTQSKNFDHSLLHMVDKFLTPGSQMRKVQDMIKDFNLEGLQQSMPLKFFWQIITLYIDQLHALELVIVEELGICLMELDTNTNSYDDAVSEQPVACHEDINSVTPSGDDNSKCDWKNMAEEEAMYKLSKMSAEQVKRLFLRHIQDENSNRLPLPDLSKEQKAIDYECIRGLTPSPMIPAADSSHSLKEWEIDLYEIEFRQRIGRGVGGTTYLAKWSGQEVAVKVSSNTDLGLEGWYTEVHSLKRLHHPNVIRLLGSVYNPSPQTYGLVLEYCYSGDLSAALHRPTPSNFFWKIADDVANGMSYLHRKQILHRDIKPGNILLDGDVVGGNFTAKLTDFGVAIMHQGNVGEEHTAETGTYRWMSPEVIRHESYSLMTDVYSYAVVVWQLITHEIPFQPLSQLEAAGKVAIESARPPLPPDTPDLVTTLIERCWSEYPDERLPFAQITIELKEIHKVLSEKDKDWLRDPCGHPVYDLSTRHNRNVTRGVESESSRDSKDSRRSKSSRESQKRSNSNDKPRRRRSGSRGKKSSANGIFSLFKK